MRIALTGTPGTGKTTVAALLPYRVIDINALVKEADSLGFKLHHPVSGKELKFFEAKVIEPLSPLGDTLDFSQASVQRSLNFGWERAKAVLG